MFNKIANEKFSKAINILKNEFALKRSMEKEACIDKLGNPIPWYTYPAIEYIKQLNFLDKIIFEFGSGNSTLFWANIAKKVISIESDKNWHNSRNKFKKNNIRLIYKKADKDYYESILKENDNFDVIIIDGKFRDKCCEVAIKKIRDNGFIVLDNSERASKFREYEDAIKILQDADLIQVDFCGFGPINDYTWATSFFFTRNFNFKSINYPLQPINIIGQMY